MDRTSKLRVDPSGAKARVLCGLNGTAEAVPYTESIVLYPRSAVLFPNFIVLFIESFMDWLLSTWYSHDAPQMDRR
jgi:hypothetical protein